MLEASIDAPDHVAAAPAAPTAARLGAAPLAAAERHAPPLLRRDFTLERELGFDALVAELEARYAGTPVDVARLLWHGGLQVDGRPVDADAPPRRVAAGSWIAAWGFLREPEPVAFGPERLLHDADGLVAVDKPAWLPMQGTRASQRLSLERRLRELLDAPRLASVHRLDRETSGVALFARDRTAAARVQRALSGRRAEKRYLAWLAPPPRAPQFRIAGLLAQVPDAQRFRYALVPAGSPGARASETVFRLLREAAGCALVEAHPLTGRTHQIRVHAAAAAAPVLGDSLYAPEPAAGAPRAERALLHAHELRLPADGAPALALVAPVPADFAR